MTKMDDCLFCKIIAKEIPSKTVYEDDNLIVFEDIHPQAPVHLLVVPKQHLVNLFDADAEACCSLGNMLLMLPKLAAERGLSDFRTVINSGKDAGQSVFHLHAHLLGGRPFRWPPG
jgi:histidine triad (HIT) family protein